MKQSESNVVDDWRERFVRDGFLSPNAQYVATHMRQTRHDRDTAILVSGVDTYGHFEKDIPATDDLDPASVARQRELDRQVRETMGLADP